MELVNARKPPNKCFKIDSIIQRAGHEVVRLPPYHCDLNAIEFVWAQVKYFIRDKNVTGDIALTKLRVLCEAALSSVCKTDWAKYVGKVKNIEEQYWRNDGILETVMERLHISSDHTDSTSDSDASLSSSNDDDEQ